MSKSILSRIVWGYGILILILILMISAFVVNITVDKFSNAQNLMTGNVQYRAERVIQAATDQLMTPSAQNLAKLELLHRELKELLGEEPETVGSFFLPEQLSGLYTEIRSEFVGQSNGAFARVSQGGGRDLQAMQEYISGGFRFIERLNDYIYQVERFRGRLVTLLIILFAVLVLAGVAVVVVYFFFYLPNLARDYKDLIRFSGAIQQGAVREQDAVPADRNDELGEIAGQLSQLEALKTALAQIDDHAIGILHSCVEMEGVTNVVYESENRQADLLEEATSGFSEIVSSIQNVCDQARNNHQTATESGNEVFSRTWDEIIPRDLV